MTSGPDETAVIKELIEGLVLDDSESSSGSGGNDEIDENESPDEVVYQPQRALNPTATPYRITQVRDSRHTDPRIEGEKNGNSDTWTTVSSEKNGRRRGDKKTRAKTIKNPRQKKWAAPDSFVPTTPPFVIILVGIPGSGKSTLTQRLTSLPRSPQQRPYVRISQDELGSRRRCEDMLRSVLSESYAVPIIDRCNFDEEQRAHFLALARRTATPVACHYVVFRADVEVCVRRCERRAGHETLLPRDARSVVRRMGSMLRVPEAAPPLPPTLGSDDRIRYHTVSDERSFAHVVEYYSSVG